MSIIPAKIPVESVAPPMHAAKLVVLVEDLRKIQNQSHELAVRQVELTTQIEMALKADQELHQKSLTDQQDVGGEA